MRRCWTPIREPLPAQGLCFAIAVNTARQVATQLMAYGRMRRSQIGLSAQNVVLPRWMIRQFDLLQDSAVLVVGAEPGGPAAVAGLAEGDLIVAADGAAISSIDDLHARLTHEHVGRPLSITLLRDERRLQLDVTPVEG